MLLTKNKKFTVKEIHDEIDAACEATVQAAMKIINPAVDKESNSRRYCELLKARGFKNCRNVKERESSEKEEKFAKMVCGYKERYPQLKFIKEEDFLGICKKYNLIYTSVDKYTGYIPEKNMKEIINCPSIGILDIPPRKHILKLRGETMNGFTKSWSGVIEKLGVVDPWSGTTGENTRQIRMKAEELGFRYASTVASEAEIIEIDMEKQELCIAADKSQFDLKGLKRDENGFGFFGKFQILPKPQNPDPIVFHHVEGGMLIVTKWGAEADEPMLQN